MVKKFDAIIVGTGQAGPSLAVRLAQSGMSVAIIERNKFGGSCVNTGCIPTKTLVASAEIAHHAQRADDFGIEINGSIKTNMEKVKERKDNIVSKASQGVEQWLKNTPNVTVVQGHASFIENYKLSVNDEVLTAEKIFINVGARASVPPIEGLDQVEYLTNSSILELDIVPGHLIVVGGSYIGLEFAQIFRRFGAKVTIIEKATSLIPREDPDVCDTVLELMQQSGIDVHLNASSLSFSASDDHITANITSNGDKKIRGSHVLIAIGRRPNTDNLGLEHTDIKVDERGIILVNDKLATTVPNIWALGECNGRGAFTHTAYNDFQIIADNLLHGAARKVTDRIQAYALYTDPSLGRCGMTEAEIRAKGYEALVAKRPMTQVKRAMIKGEPIGFIKVLIDKSTKKILGAAIIGVNADEIIHSILDVMYADKPYTLLRDAVHIHPTVSELIPTTLENLNPLES
ncbi:mercuric reductase [Legionella antarctica]|uniref:Mercuric reductase n=1 Tax=Legionella antarctica TaxID=2708020 RepID=A0A6F8T5Q4_9GAMM|nr:FAD-containing oxidoreductase [Legionella antarctica]BCA95296.1 mercuric reductase [Legionella antarctica]